MCSLFVFTFVFLPDFLHGCHFPANPSLAATCEDEYARFVPFVTPTSRLETWGHARKTLRLLRVLSSPIRSRSCLQPERSLPLLDTFVLQISRMAPTPLEMSKIAEGLARKLVKTTITDEGMVLSFFLCSHPMNR